jgi:peptidoglycan/LPS O-acetylase OafA/YrhL
MLPVIGWLALRRFAGKVSRQALLLGGFAVAGLAWNAVDYAAGWGPVAAHSPPSFLPYFACGMLVALLVESRRARNAAPLGRGASAALVAGAAVVLLLNGWWHATFAHDTVAMELLADSGAALAFAAIIGALVLGTGTGVRWIGLRPFAWMGEIAYGFYLWHIPLLVCARGLGILPSGIVLGLAVLPVAIAFGAASWYWIEQPFMRRAARLPRAASEARSARSRSRIPAHSGSRPASSSGRAAASSR